MNLTIRNIPEYVIEKLRTISKMQRRSLNNEILFVLERGMEEEINHNYHSEKKISKSIQTELWNKLSGMWQDSRTTDEIIDDIYKSRTLGREFKI